MAPSRSTTPSQQPYSTPHMLMALCTGFGLAFLLMGGHRKRFHTKFSVEKKEKMHELLEKLRWIVQKRDDIMVE